MRLGMEGKIRRVEVKQLSEDTTEWYYGILRATKIETNITIGYNG